MSEIVSSGVFDYSVLPAEVADQARAAAARVRARQKNVIAGILDTGRDLSTIKDKLDHGQFGDWVAAEFGMTIRTAQNYMSASSAFDGKSEMISHFPPTVVYALAAPSTPEPVRQTVFAKYEAGERLEPAVVKVMVREAKAAEKQTMKVTGVAAKRLRAERAQQRRIEKADREIEERVEREREAASHVVTFLKDQLGEAFFEFLELMSRTDAYRFSEALKTEVAAPAYSPPAPSVPTGAQASYDFHNGLTDMAARKAKAAQ